MDLNDFAWWIITFMHAITICHLLHVYFNDVNLSIYADVLCYNMIHKHDMTWICWLPFVLLIVSTFYVFIVMHPCIQSMSPRPIMNETSTLMFYVMLTYSFLSVMPFIYNSSKWLHVMYEKTVDSSLSECVIFDACYIY